MQSPCISVYVTGCMLKMHDYNYLCVFFGSVRVQRQKHLLNSLVVIQYGSLTGTDQVVLSKNKNNNYC